MIQNNSEIDVFLSQLLIFNRTFTKEYIQKLFEPQNRSKEIVNMFRTCFFRRNYFSNITIEDRKTFNLIYYDSKSIRKRGRIPGIYKFTKKGYEAAENAIKEINYTSEPIDDIVLPFIDNDLSEEEKLLELAKAEIKVDLYNKTAVITHPNVVKKHFFNSIPPLVQAGILVPHLLVKDSDIVGTAFVYIVLNEKSAEEVAKSLQRIENNIPIGVWNINEDYDFFHPLMDETIQSKILFSIIKESKEEIKFNVLSGKENNGGSR